jgi:hypothetical protein
MPELSVLFKQLPFEILHIILTYNGTIKCRNGKYMNQLSRTDKRYDLLQYITKPVAFLNNDVFFCFTIHFTNDKHTLVITNLNKYYRVDNINYNFWATDPKFGTGYRNYKKYIRY